MDLQGMLFDYVDRFRSLLPPGAWQGLARDLAKNDVLTLLYLHRTQPSRMSDLAAYLDAPLNTATGAVTRLQQRGLVEREHSPDDNRIVLISLNAEGRRLIPQSNKESVPLIGSPFAELTNEKQEEALRLLDPHTAWWAECSANRRPQTVRRIPID